MKRKILSLPTYRNKKAKRSLEDFSQDPVKNLLYAIKGTQFEPFYSRKNKIRPFTNRNGALSYIGGAILKKWITNGIDSLVDRFSGTKSINLIPSRFDTPFNTHFNRKTRTKSKIFNNRNGLSYGGLITRMLLHPEVQKRSKQYPINSYTHLLPSTLQGISKEILK